MNGMFAAWLRDSTSLPGLLDFLDLTLSLLQPRLLIALGPNTAAFLAKRWPEPLAAWSSRSIAGLNRLPKARLPQQPYGSAVACAVLHPCLAHTNYRHRSAPYNSAAGEALLLRESWQAASASG